MASDFKPLEEADAIRRSQRVRDSLEKESDRGIALVAAAFCNDMLETILRSHFMSRPDKSVDFMEPLFFGPLATFSAKIRLAYALDLLLEDWMATDLDIIKKVRNLFAHELASLTYGDPRIVALTDRLVGPSEYSKTVGHDPPEDKMSAESRSRYRFIVGTFFNGCFLHTRAVVQRLSHDATAGATG